MGWPGRSRRPDAVYDGELQVHFEMAAYEDGHQLLPRTIRYIEDRRKEERRYTAAIEEHPSSLHIVWGKLDPVASYPMAERLAGLRPEATFVTFEDVGHYPMLEAPDRFTKPCSPPSDAPFGASLRCSSADDSRRNEGCQRRRRKAALSWKRPGAPSGVVAYLPVAA